jgi:membrane protein implicated in regulation of membrane protease activity
MEGLKLVPVQILVFLKLFSGAGVFSGAVFLYFSVLVFLFFSVLVFFSVRCFSKNRKHRTPELNFKQTFQWDFA